MKLVSSKNPRVSNELPTCYTVLSQLITGGIEHILGDSAGREALEACAWFSMNFTPCVFSFRQFCFISFQCNKF